MKLPTSALSLRRSAVAVSVAMAITGVAACGSSNTSTTAATPTPSSTGSTTTSPPTATTTSTPSTGPSSAAPTAKSVAPVPVESNPPGDIPDNLAFVPYTNKAGGYSFTHPEGWAQTGRGNQVLFTDKLNGVAVDSVPAQRAPTVASARSADVARLQSSVPAFELGDISAVTVPGGQGVRIVFRRNSEADSVTGKVYRDEVEEYLVFHAGTLVRMDLYGPVGADNVDAYRTMSQSLTIR